MSSPLALISFKDGPTAPFEKKRRPIVKLVKTQPRLNGKYAWVRAFYRTRDRYAVTLLESDVSTKGHPALLYFGWDELESLEHDESNVHTLFLPPSTIGHLSWLDITSLYLQYVALHKLSSPKLATWVQSIQQTIQQTTDALPPLSRGLFIVILLPWLLSILLRMYTDYQSQDSSIITSQNTQDNPSNTILSLHTSDMITLISFLIGTNTIAHFLHSEYTTVKQKAEAMQLSRAFTTAEMLECRVDYYFSTSKWAKVGFLLSLTFMLIAIGAGLFAMFLEDHSISSAAWLSWTHVVDPGTHANAPKGLLVRLVSFSITVGGMIIFALMIGIISDSIGDKRVIESGHSVILGWNDKSLAIIQQIALANESEGGGTIVVLADCGKEELEEMLNAAVSSTENPLRLLGTEVIIRSGNPLLESELRKISVNSARSVISLSNTNDDMDPDEADANQVRQVMALKTFEGFENACHVVVELQDLDNMELCNLVAPNFAKVIVTNDLIGRLMLQCARCPGLALVVEEMMGFEGSEFYLEEWPELVGKTFYDITYRFDDAVPLGIRHQNGSVSINPPNDKKIAEGDKILVLAEDNDSYEVNDDSYLPCSYATECILKIIPGRPRRYCSVDGVATWISQLDEYVEKGSELWLLNLVPSAERAELLKDKGNKADLDLKNLSIYNVVGNPIIRRDLSGMRAVDVKGEFTDDTITLREFDSILILADAVAIERGANMMSCDSRSLSSLLIFQDVMTKQYEAQKAIDPNTHPPCLPVSEILDTRTKSLLKVVEGKMGYIMSNQIISAVMAQVSEEQDINIVLREILTAEGSETFIRPITRIVDLS
ncbi:LOW QUALITY PROTEIN: hypothetical protein ACHAXN_000928 [Cyclotella atomus]